MTTVRRVPDAPKTPLRSFRVDDELWNAARDLAEQRGETVTQVIREALARYVAEGAPATTSPDDRTR